MHLLLLQVCADATVSATCAGDSGSPVLLDGTTIQVGINSFSNGGGSCDSQTLDAYTRISYFYDWIQDQICIMSDDPPTSCQPSAAPSQVPSQIPSAAPSAMPSSEPSSMPSSVPSAAPSVSSMPSHSPSSVPSYIPSELPTFAPTMQAFEPRCCWQRCCDWCCDKARNVMNFITKGTKRLLGVAGGNSIDE